MKLDSEETVNWITKSAEQDDLVSQYNLGVCYINGLVVKKDVEETVKLYRTAAKKGNWETQKNLGKHR